MISGNDSTTPAFPFHENPMPTHQITTIPFFCPRRRPYFLGGIGIALDFHDWFLLLISRLCAACYFSTVEHFNYLPKLSRGRVPKQRAKLKPWTTESEWMIMFKFGQIYIASLVHLPGMCSLPYISYGILHAPPRFLYHWASFPFSVGQKSVWGLPRFLSALLFFAGAGFVTDNMWLSWEVISHWSILVLYNFGRYPIPSLKLT